MSTANQLGGTMRDQQAGMPNGLSVAVFFILVLISLAVAFGVSLVSPPLGIVVFIAEFILSS